MRLSIVIPTHDTCAMTLRCVAAVEAARRPDDDVLLVDDGTDGTGAEVRRAHPGVHVHTHARNEGFTASVNEGLAEADGDLLLALNSDALVDAWALDAIRAAFEKDPHLGVASPSLVGADGTPQWIGGGVPTQAWLFVLATGLGPWLRRVRGSGRARRPGDHVDWVTGAAMVIRRPVWDAIGPFDHRFRFYAQDLDLCLRARDAGWRVGVIEEARVVHLGGASVAPLPGALGAAHPAWLWADLLRWAEKRHGADWARRAAVSMRVGSGLRLAWRAVARLVVASGKAAWDRDTEALRGARSALRVPMGPRQSRPAAV